MMHLKRTIKPLGLWVLSAAVAGAAFLSGCDLFNQFKGEILKEDRDIRVDVQNLIFNARTLTNEWERGLGAVSVDITVTTDTNTYSKKLDSSQKDAVFNYSAVQIPVSGKLLSVSAVINTIDKSFTASLDKAGDPSYWSGWEVFANVTKFRLSADIDTAEVLNSIALIDICPRGGSSLRLRTDSGVTAEENGKTDRWDTLVSGQIAIEPQFLENPSGLSYTLYYGIFEEDVKSLNDPAVTPEAEYYMHPWASVWTVEELTETGRVIGTTLYKLAAYTPVVTNAANPMGDGLKSFLVDLTERTNLASLIGRYLVAGIVVEYGTLKVPGGMICVEIK